METICAHCGFQMLIEEDCCPLCGSTSRKAIEESEWTIKSLDAAEFTKDAVLDDLLY
jgi:hypothetical protein